VTVLREVTAEDIPALTALQRAFDVAWFGAPEHDEDEVREWLDLGDANCVVEDGDRLIAAGSRWRTGSALTVDPGGDVDAARLRPTCLRATGGCALRWRRRVGDTSGRRSS
jgi:hypothetical protein